MSLTKACMCKNRGLLYIAHMGTEGLKDLLILWHIFMFLNFSFLQCFFPCGLNESRKIKQLDTKKKINEKMK